MSSRFLLYLFLLLIAACSGQNSGDHPAVSTPPIASAPSPASPRSEPATTNTPEPQTNSDSPSQYWGVKPGEPLPIIWEDLLPEGAIETYFAQQDEFYADMERQMKSGAVLLSEVDPMAEIEEGSAQDYMPQFGTFDAVNDLDGQLIRIPGYVVPFEFASDDKYSEFLFVPYMGACLHTPPPPPNQVIFVRAEKKVRVKDIWAAYWLEGDLQVERNMNDLGNAAYSLDLTGLELYPVP